MTQQISPRDYELLSAYLDGELSARDRARLEARMTKQPELRLGLDELRQTSILLRSLPRKRAPRNFTIPNTVSRRRPVPRLFPALRFASALAGILFLIVFVGDYALGISTRGLASKIPASTSAPAAVMSNPVSRDLATTAAAPAAPALPSPDNPPAAMAPSPTETGAPEAMSAMVAAPDETPSEEPGAAQSTDQPLLGFSSQALGTETPPSGMGGGAGTEGYACGETCTPQPTETPAPTSAADTSDATNEVSPTSPPIGSSAAGSAPAATTPPPASAPTVENPPVPEFTPEASMGSKLGATGQTESGPTPTPESGARVWTPMETPPAPAPSAEPQLKAPAVTGSSQVTPESPAAVPGPAGGFGPMVTAETAPTEQPSLQEKLSQPYSQMILHLAEIGLAGFAILAGLAAIFLRLNSRS